MAFNRQDFLKSIEKDVEYYNKDITKIKQRNNKVSDIDELIPLSSSLGFVSPCATPLTEEVVMSPTSLEVEGQEEAEPDFSQDRIQAPTSPKDLIRPEHVKRAILQYYQNQGVNKLQKHKLKIRLNCDFGEGEESVEFIAALTQDLGNFKKYHPEDSKEYMQQWVDSARSDIRYRYEIKPHMGKFHNNSGWNHKGTQFNQIEPWTACLVWYDRDQRIYRALVRIYEWEEIFELGTDTVTDRQAKANVKAQALWHNPLHLNIQRPKTWAEKRFGAKK